MEPFTYAVDPEPELASLVYVFGGHPPVASIKPGTAVATSTLDCFAGQVRGPEDLPSRVCDPRYLNPQTGPFFVEGAEPGDTLAVHFVRIEPRADWGVSAAIPYFGALTSTPTTATLQPPLPETVWIYDLDPSNRTVGFRARESGLQLELPMDPMHGTVGVAPALGEVRSALAPGPWGGNMDTPEMRAGVTCYLGVNVEGALLSLGDGHARQGEGEPCGVAVECAMDTVFIVDVIKGMPTAWPRLESDAYLMTTGSTKPLEDAFRIAHVEMTHWVAQLLGISVMDAYQLVAQVAESPIANVCDTVYTTVCKVRKDHLGAAPAMQGTHRRLRELAEQF